MDHHCMPRGTLKNKKKIQLFIIISFIIFKLKNIISPYTFGIFLYWSYTFLKTLNDIIILYYFLVHY